MNEWIVMICCAMILIVFYLLLYWKKIDKNLFLAAAELIPEAEEIFLDREKSGEQKKEWVVEQLMEMIPILFRKLFNTENIGELVQFVFDRISKFGKVK